MMAATAKYRDDIAGAIVTGGTSTAYTVSSYQVFGTLEHLDGQLIAFTPHVTNAATVTLNVDSLGAKPLRSAPGVELLAGTLILGTPYTAVYNHSDAAFCLRGFFGNPYNIPLGGCLPFFGQTAPNSSFVLPYGQAISRATYSKLFTMFGTTYGSGDGSTTFNVPDLRGRVIAGKGDMGGVDLGLLSTIGLGASGTTLGAVGGAQAITLSANQIPSLTLVNASQAISVSGTTNTRGTNNSTSFVGGGAVGAYFPDSGAVFATVTSTGNNSISVAYTNTSQTVTKTVQPTIICNYIVRII
jgi:microcystin-dependent protein